MVSQVSKDDGAIIWASLLQNFRKIYLNSITSSVVCEWLYLLQSELPDFFSRLFLMGCNFCDQQPVVIEFMAAYKLKFSLDA